MVRRTSEEEEKRVLYVAVTRAEEQFILISHSKGKETKAKLFIQDFLESKPNFSESLKLKIDDYKEVF
ncbi:hypothetical protein [Colwellia sp. BRX8-9]|uniref:hypothetical protein n=1 Tax=Colwellia sp. BRX8-9 TaxID=2759831 RepID=UPI0015F6C26A|nr:hypothetical protein [Colwellia sp. BRX8-9]MBA6350396.1 hypothetical protein [Colwellia sp. BRX8-9]